MFILRDPKRQLMHQLSSLYPWGGMDKAVNLVYPKVIEKMERCFCKISNKYYFHEGETIFEPLHVAQWTMFLYMMSRQLYKESPEYLEISDMIYGLNKMVSSADLFYMVDMPDIWFFDHPQGSVMGRAEYADFFSFSQNCTVGNNHGIYPRFGEHVSMMSGSKVLGDCKVGDHVILSANSYIIDQDIPSYSIVFGSNSNLTIHRITESEFDRLTGSYFKSV